MWRTEALAELCEVELGGDGRCGRRPDFNAGWEGFELGGVVFKEDNGAAEGGCGVTARGRSVDGLSVAVTRFKDAGGRALICVGLWLRQRESEGAPEIFRIKVALEFTGGVACGTNRVIISVSRGEFDPDLQE